MENELKLFSKEWAIEMTQDIQNAKQNWDYLVEAFSHKAKIDKLTYDSYINEGFSSEEALYLTRR